MLLSLCKEKTRHGRGKSNGGCSAHLNPVISCHLISSLSLFLSFIHFPKASSSPDLTSCAASCRPQNRWGIPAYQGGKKQAYYCIWLLNATMNAIHCWLYFKSCSLNSRRHIVYIYIYIYIYIHTHTYMYIYLYIWWVYLQKQITQCLKMFKKHVFYYVL